MRFSEHKLSDINDEEPTTPPFPAWFRDIGRETPEK
jgi:hypothetical protein